ncbi:MAG: carboxypeptidase regulatory-like domain-containing protein, partial [Acidobacteria bacterium]|nr:carboxypeptidase regulatory-like domain-containing protein [Acidobacteriota bacterium]
MKTRLSAMIAALWLTAMAVASAQETTGTLTGKLSDGQGLALPGVTVTITGPQGAKSFVTDAEGLFRAPFL